MKIVSSEAMAQIDGRTQSEFAIPGTLLMEDAGVKAWGASRRLTGVGRSSRGPLVFLAGRGNNGGDALVMARQARVEGTRSTTIVLVGDEPSPGSDPATMLAACRGIGIECLRWPDDEAAVRERIASASWIFDGIAGTGIRGPLRQPATDLVTAVNGRGGRVIAIDVPSGLGDTWRADFPVIHAAATLTMGLPKRCLYLPRARTLCGRILVIPVGFPPSLLTDSSIPGELVPLSAWKRLLPAIPADAHKGTRGHLAVFAGSKGTTGAAWLCAMAAARSRVGLVTIFADADSYPVLASKLASVMCRALPAAGTGEWSAARFSAILAGPGWGLGEDRTRWLAALVAQGLPGVIDADGITLLARMASANGGIDLQRRWVLTPHPGEFARLTGIDTDAVLDDPVGHACAASARMNAVIVLKGHCTVVATPDGRYRILDAVNPALATGGSGDVLAGVIAAGLAAGMAPDAAAVFGVSLHATVGRIALRRRGWFLAEDLVPLLSRTLRG